MKASNMDATKHSEIALYNTESWFFEDFEVGARVRSIRRTISEGESMAFNHINAHEYRAVRHDGNGFVRENSIFELTNGGKKLICHAWAQQKPGGPEVAFDEIFDKAP